jgi:hypothetical protein
MHFILLHVKFEDGLFISVLRNRATLHKNQQLEIVKFRKMSKGPPIFLFQTPPFSNIHAIGQDLPHRRMPEFPTKLPRHIQKVKL